ncbi:MAG: hypothetical protein IPM53_24505 [Anaerolineaceae bacterium]|nr:hypothetical protein [Anaerolineaceae bacterium]
MRRFIWLLLLSMLIACAVSPTDEQANNQVENWRVFTSSTYGFTLHYPANWQAQEYLDGSKGDRNVIATIIPPTPFTAAITIKRDEMENPTVEDVADWGEELITRRFASTAYEVYELESIELANGESALTRTYLTAIDKPVSSRYTEIYIAREHDGLMIQMGAVENKYDSVEAVFEHLIESFTLIASE